MNRPSVPLSGLHHVTAIAGDPGANHAFYTEVLGQRLVKKTVNFDEPNTYHLYYGNEGGEPGSILTFFPWPGARRGTAGAGQATTTSYLVPPGSSTYWHDRLRAAQVTVEPPKERFGELVLTLLDPDGMRLELVESPGAEKLDAWLGSHASPIDERFAIRGLRGVTLSTAEGSLTASFLSKALGFSEVAQEGATTRFRIAQGPLGALLDLETMNQHGRSGAGAVHHIAFRIRDDASELDWQSHLAEYGSQVSPVMDRQYFRSIYFREPGGVLFEIATDPPGFTVDEAADSLGSSLKLPAFLEEQRSRIEAALPNLGVKAPGAAL